LPVSITICNSLSLELAFLQGRNCRFKRIQYRAALIDAFLARTGLTFEPGPP
jgi:hypothetical protein